MHIIIFKISFLLSFSYEINELVSLAFYTCPVTYSGISQILSLYFFSARTFRSYLYIFTVVLRARRDDRLQNEGDALRSRMKDPPSFPLFFFAEIFLLKKFEKCPRFQSDNVHNKIHINVSQLGEGKLFFKKPRMQKYI